MKRFTSVLTLVLVLFLTYAPSAISQHITASTVAEWQRPGKLGPEFNRNSVSIHLVNGGKLADLFTGAGLTREEQKKIRLRRADYPKYLYFYATLPDPKQAGTQLTFPLYLFDTQDKSNSNYTETLQGKVLDQVSDEVLGSNSLFANGTIKAIKGNKTAETTSEIFALSTDLYKTAAAVSSGPLGTPELLGLLNKGGSYFTDMAQGRTASSQFPIPILNREYPNYSYTLVSATLQQIKWEISPDETNPWPGVAGKADVLMDQLKGAIPKDKPYLLIVRYKSKFVLPSNYYNTISYDPNYLTTRESLLPNLVGYEFDREDALLKVLKRSVALRKDVDTYKASRLKGNVDYDALNRAINSLFAMKELHAGEVSATSRDLKILNYFNNYYALAYKQIFTTCAGDLTSAGADEVVPFVESLRKLSATKRAEVQALSDKDLAANLTQLDYYRRLTPRLTTPPSTGDPSSVWGVAKSSLDVLEKEQNARIAKKAEGASPSDQKNYFAGITAGYPSCELCKSEAERALLVLEQRSTAAIREELQALKTNGLSILKCCSDNTAAVQLALKTKYPDEATVPISDKLFYQQCQRNCQNLSELMTRIAGLGALDVASMDTKTINEKLVYFRQSMNDFDSNLKEFVAAQILPTPPCIK